MDLIRGLHNLKTFERGCVVTIGNFDGVHRGHQAILSQLEKKGKELGLPTVLITFDPQPQEFFQPGNLPPRLTCLREKIITLMTQTHIDVLLCLHFNLHLAYLQASDFVQQILVERLRARMLIVGDDFRFGYRREGDFQLLTTLGKQYGFDVIPTATVLHEGRRISSSWIREALAAGDLVLVETLLQRPYSFHGRVVRGDQRGRIIGFPTANVNLHRRTSPIWGVYAVKVYGLGPVREGVANVGNRPTVDGTRTLLEVHLFDFNEDIYGRAIRVDFIHKLRDEQHFDSFDLLKAQILKDAQAARDFLGGLRIS